MSSSGGVFSQTLKSITDTKLAELSKKRAFFEDQKTALLTAVQAETDQKKRVQLLLDGVRETFLVKSVKRKRGDERALPANTGNPSLEIEVSNLQRFLDQARYDPSISPKLLENWAHTLTKQLDVQSLKHQYATLYGELVNEWLSEEKAAEALAGKDVEQVEGFEKVEWKEKDDSRAEWEDLVFQPFETDQMAIGTYLTNLFGQGTDKKVLEALANFHESVEAFETTLTSPGQFNEKVLRWVIEGLLDSDLFMDEKRAVAKDFLGNSIILTEVADVLNMRLASLQTWSWEDHVPLETRRNVNGDCQIYMHEDLLQAMFLQFIGVKWSVFFKSAFKKFSESQGAWSHSEVPEIDKQRRQCFLGHRQTTPSVQSRRQELYKSRYFMSQLLNKEDEKSLAVDGEMEVNYEKALGKTRSVSMKKKALQRQATGFDSVRMRKAPQEYHGTTFRYSSVPEEYQDDAEVFNFQDDEDEDDDEGESGDGGDKPKSPMRIKQLLLHLLSTEIILNTELHGEITTLSAEFDQWGPSLPHSTIISVLNFLGVSNKWLKFFRTFLEAPLKFMEDGPSGQIKKRKRGVPQSHVLSAVFGEVILFCMDYSVNQSTGGTPLFRMSDDFWIWSTSHQTIVTAWKAINQFKDTMGVTINPDKTGSVRILRDKKAPLVIDPSLPKGEIRWGFLILDSSTGRFLIDQKIVDTHILELQRQLRGKTSIFSFIQAWNTYAGTFFTSNFGKPANCFGREHVDMMLSTLSRIQRCIFPSTSTLTTEGAEATNSIATYLKTTIATRFGITDIPDGYLYFTTPLGGLELHNPFVGLLQLRDSLWENPSTAFSDFLDAEKERYQNAKTVYENRMTANALNDTGNRFGAPNAQQPAQFFSFSEFTKYREEFSFGHGYSYNEGYYNNDNADLYKIFEGLLKMPKEESVLRNVEMVQALKRLGGASKEGGIGSDWKKMTPYWRWVVELYGGEMVERFGGLNAVDGGVLPVGMVGLVRGGRVKWQG